MTKLQSIPYELVDLIMGFLHNNALAACCKLWHNWFRLYRIKITGCDTAKPLIDYCQANGVEPHTTARFSLQCEDVLASVQLSYFTGLQQFEFRSWSRSWQLDQSLCDALHAHWLKPNQATLNNLALDSLKDSFHLQLIQALHLETFSLTSLSIKVDNTETAEALISNLQTCLTSLDLSAKSFKLPLHALWANFPDLRSLALQSTAYETDYQFPNLFPVLKPAPSLTFLNLHSIQQVKDKEWRLTPTYFPRLVKLTLDWDRTDDLTQAFIGEMMPQIVDLYVDHWGGTYTSTHTKDLGDALQKAVSMQIYSTYIPTGNDTSAVTPLLQSLATLPKLRDVDLFMDTAHGDEQLQGLYEFLMSENCQRQLEAFRYNFDFKDSSGCNLDEHCGNIFSALSTMESLCNLGVTFSIRKGPSPSEEAVQKLTCPRLKELNFTVNAREWKTFALATVLTPSLERLKLDCAALPLSTVASTKDALGKCTSLTRLELDNTKEGHVEKLVKHFPASVTYFRARPKPSEAALLQFQETHPWATVKGLHLPPGLAAPKDAGFP